MTGADGNTYADDHVTVIVTGGRDQVNEALELIRRVLILERIKRKFSENPAHMDRYVARARAYFVEEDYV